MTTSHTTGPWHIAPRETLEDGSIYPMRITGPNDIEVCPLEANSIAELAMKYPGTFWGESRVKKANAALICAAPEIFDALQDAEFLMRKIAAHPNEIMAMRDSFIRSAESARAALAKAKGE